MQIGMALRGADLPLLDQAILPIDFATLRSEVGSAAVIEGEIEGLSPASAIQMRTTEQFYAASTRRKTHSSMLQKLIRSGNVSSLWEEIKTMVEFRIAKSAIPVSWTNSEGITDSDVDRAVFCLLLVPECLHSGDRHGSQEVDKRKVRQRSENNVERGAAACCNARAVLFLRT